MQIFTTSNPIRDIRDKMDAIARPLQSLAATNLHGLSDADGTNLWIQIGTIRGQFNKLEALLRGIEHRMSDETISRKAGT